MLLSRAGFTSAARREHGWPRPVAALPRPAVQRGARVLRPLALASASRDDVPGASTREADWPRAVNSQLGNPADPAQFRLDDGTGGPPSSAVGGSGYGSGSGSGSGRGGRSGGHVALRGFGGGGDPGPKHRPVNIDPHVISVAILAAGGVASWLIIMSGVASVATACAGAGAAVATAMTMVVMAPIAIVGGTVAAVGAMCSAMVDAIATSSAAGGAAALAYQGAEAALQWWEAQQQGRRQQEPGRGDSRGGSGDGRRRRGRASGATAAAAAAAAGATGAAGGGAGRGGDGEAGSEEAGEEQEEDWSSMARRVALQTAAACVAAAGVFAVRALATASSAVPLDGPPYGSSSRRRSTFGDALSDPGSSAAPSAAAGP